MQIFKLENSCGETVDSITVSSPPPMTWRAKTRTRWSCWCWVSGDVSILAAGRFLFSVLAPAHSLYPLQPHKALWVSSISSISFLGGYGPLLSSSLNVSFAVSCFFLSFLPFASLTQLYLASSFTYLFIC